MRMSHSRVSTFNTCPFQYDLKYNQKLKTIFDCDPQSPLILGKALHTGLEKSVDDAIKEYYFAYPIIDDRHIAEAIKLEYLIPKAKQKLPQGLHEVKIKDDDFVGYIDLLVPISNGTEEVTEYDIYDFKYLNNIDKYRDSTQLHLYKYYFEKLNPGKRVRNLRYMFIPKVMIRQKKKNKTNKRDETIYEFRQRILEELDKKDIQFLDVEYDPNKVIEFLSDTKHLIECKEFNKNQTKLCDWCEYQNYCEKGETIDMLPKNERVEIGSTNYMKGWIYGAPFSGKTTFLDAAPDPINLNTDGNTKYVTMQRIHIRDEVTTEGRMTKKRFAWDILKEAISDLEKGSDFKTVILDLAEDAREMCRLYMYNKLNIEHESDDAFRAWDKVKTEYLSTMKRLLNLDYNIFLVSHEDISKDLTKKSGDKVSRIAPNIQEALANKLAGMVDFVARVVVNDDGSRVLSFKTTEVVFGGGRLHIDVDEIPLEWDELMKVYELANKKAVKTAPKATQKQPEVVEPEENVETKAEAEDVPEVTEEQPAPRRKRRVKSDD